MASMASIHSITITEGFLLRSCACCCGASFNCGFSIGGIGSSIALSVADPEQVTKCKFNKYKRNDNN